MRSEKYFRIILLVERLWYAWSLNLNYFAPFSNFKNMQNENIQNLY